MLYHGSTFTRETQGDGMATLSNKGPQSTIQDNAELLAEPSASANKTLSVHRWTNWIAGFSGEFAHDVINQYVPAPTEDSLVVDPFAGVGTTLVEAYRQGINSVGFEINPFAALVCQVKLAAPKIHIPTLQEAVVRYDRLMDSVDNSNGNGADFAHHSPRTSYPQGFKSRVPFFSPKVERKVLHTLDFIADLDPLTKDIFRVALASVLVELSNYSYEPSLGSRAAAGKETILDAPVGHVVGRKLKQMVEDISELQAQTSMHRRNVAARLHPVSFFDAEQYLEAGSIDLIVTSPPYMNNYHYVRNTRPQLFWTNLVTSSADLKELEEQNFGKYWQTVRAQQPVNMDFSLPELEQEVAELRQLNPDKGVYGGNGWANYVTSYMNDLHKFCRIALRSPAARRRCSHRHWQFCDSGQGDRRRPTPLAHRRVARAHDHRQHQGPQPGWHEHCEHWAAHGGPVQA